MEQDIDSRIDRYMNRELDPSAARALAQAALDDSELFDELTAVALAQAALESPATTDRALAQSALDDEDLFDTLVARGALEIGLPAQHQPKRWWIAVAGVGAVAAGLLTFFILRPSAPPIPQPQPQTLALTAKPRPTILLTADLQPPGSASSPIFRGEETASRAPKSEGAVVSIVDGIATVNLGSIDGLAKGQQIGSIVITTVFRDRARGKIINGDSPRVNDTVRIPNSTHLRAILQQVDALAAGGNLTAARDLAHQSIAAGSPGETRPLLERLAALDYQAGTADAARERYEVAVNNFDQPPAAGPAERAATLASYGALCLMHGDPQRAEELLQKGLVVASELALRSEILGNLGAAAEIRLDQIKAAGYYHQALALTPSKADRDVIAANLARLNRTPHP